MEDLGTEITKVRHTTHGDFELNAMISQGIKSFIYSTNQDMPAVHKEALDMIALKISRICSGQSMHDDHWIDIIGYATLALSYVHKENKA